jgi:O-antigen ligase
MRHLQKIALFVFFFSINFEVWDPFNTNGFFSVSKLTGYIYLITMVPFLIHNITNDYTKKILNPILIFFGLHTLVSIININSFSYSFFDFSIFQNIVLFWILLNHEQYDRLILEKGMFSFALGSITVALLFNAGIGIEYEGGRVSIFGDNQNIIGLRMSISIIVILTVILQNKLHLNKLRYLLLIPIPLMLKLMAESGSRVAVISFVLAFITGGFLLKTKKVWMKAIVLCMGTIVFIAVWQYFMQNEVLSSRLLLSIQEGDLSERNIIWKRLIPLMKSSPIFGVGKTGYDLFSILTFGDIYSPHNVLIEVFCLTGITGLFFYLLFLFKIYKKGVSQYRNEGALLPLILLIPVLGLLFSAQILNVKIGWIIFAYIASSKYSGLQSEYLLYEGKAP